MVRGSSPESPGRRVRVIFLVCCIASLFYYVFVLSPAPTWYNYFPTVMTRYSLLVLKVLLNPKQTNKPRVFVGLRPRNSGTPRGWGLKSAGRGTPRVWDGSRVWPPRSWHAYASYSTSVNSLRAVIAKHGFNYGFWWSRLELRENDYKLGCYG